MAEALTNALAFRQGIDVTAESAGTVPGTQVNPMAVAAMEEIGFSMDGHHPKPLTQAMVDRADLVVTMGCGVDAEACPARIVISEDWGLPDPAGQGLDAVRPIRDAISRRVQQLLERAPAKSASP
jgi:protein-tyrosine-phosphatase